MRPVYLAPYFAFQLGPRSRCATSSNEMLRLSSVKIYIRIVGFVEFIVSNTFFPSWTVDDIFQVEVEVTLGTDNNLLVVLDVLETAEMHN